MSGMLGFCNGTDAAWILTDAAWTRPADGRLAAIRRKQTITKNGTVVAGLGLWSSVARLAQLIDERCRNFDAVVEAAPQLWAEARTVLSADEEKQPNSVALAGFSDEFGCPEIHAFEPNGEFKTEITALGKGPADDCWKTTRPFVQSFADPAARDAFDPRDALPIFEALRRDHPRPYGDGLHHAVGGFVMCNHITRTSIETRIIRHWPDRFGCLIDPDAEVDPDKVCDRNWWDMPLAEIFKMREAFTNQIVKFGAESAEAA